MIKKHTHTYTHARTHAHKECLKISMNGVIWTATLAHACVHAHGCSETQHGLHVTGSVNWLRPVERSQCEKECHSAMEQTKLCYKLGKTATETCEMFVHVFGRETVSRKCVYECFKRFREGQETTEDEPRSGRPSTSRTPEMIEKMRQMLAQDRRPTLRLILRRNWALARTWRTPSSAMIWVSGRSAHDLCCTSSQMSRKPNGWKLLETSFPCVTRIHCFSKTSSRKWDMVLPVRSGNKTAIDGVAFTDFPATKKESSAKLQGQNTVDRLLRQQRHS